MIERIISSLAILKVNTDHGQTYFDTYVPFVAECIRQGQHEQVSLPLLQEDVAREFGLQIPQTVLKTILKRVYRTGYLQFSRGIYHRNNQSLQLPEFLPERNKALRQFEALIQRLREFCARHFRTEWSKEEAEAALFSFLDNHSLGILQTSIRGRPLVPHAAPPEHTDFLVGAFITQIGQQDPEGFAFLETVVKGRMLADMLILPGGLTTSTSFKDVHVYLDTTFVLRVIGIAHQHLRTPCRELVELLRSQRATLHIFEHTFTEIENLLLATKGRIGNLRQGNGSMGETVEYFVQNNARPSDIDMLLGRLPDLLAAESITVVPAPKHERHLGIDEVKLQQTLQDELGYKHGSTLQRDLCSLTAIYRMREGRLYSRIEQCRAVFVTTNNRLAAVSTRFFQQEHDNGSLSIPHCVTDQVMATLAWLKAPTRAPNLPRQLLIANCYAALKPQEALWQKYLAEIDRLLTQGRISEHDYYLLRYTSTARDALMEFTLGEPDVFTEGTVDEVLARAHAEARREVEEKAELERTQRQAAEIRLVQVSDTVAQARAAYQRRIALLSARGGRIVGYTSRIFLISILVATAIMAAPWPFLNQPTDAVRWAICASVLVAALASIWSMYRGTTIAQVINVIEGWATNACERVLTRAAYWLNLDFPEITPSGNATNSSVTKGGN